MAKYSHNMTVLRRWNADDFPRLNGEPWRRCLGREQSRRRRTRDGLGTDSDGGCTADEIPVWRLKAIGYYGYHDGYQNLLGDSVFWSRDRKFEKRHGSYRFLHHLFFVQLVYVMFYQWKMVANRYVQHLLYALLVDYPNPKAVEFQGCSNTPCLRGRNDPTSITEMS